MTLTHQRLFGRTKLDAFDFPFQGWYMIESGVETQITATSAQLNGLAALPLAGATVDVANDEFVFLDHSDSHKGKYDSIVDFVAAVGGTTATSGLSNASGVLKVDPTDAAHAINGDYFLYMSAAGVPHKDLMTDVVGSMVGAAGTTGLTHTNGVMSVAPEDFAITVGADSLVYMTAAGLPKKEAVADFATAFAGEGLVGAAGKVCLLDNGQTSQGGVFFTNPGDCDSITVGAVDYPRGVVQDVTIGRWVAGASAADSAASLAACINGDTRAPLVYTAEAIGDGVVIRAITPGTAGNVAVAKTGAAPAEPSTLQNLTEGRSAKTCQVGSVYHTVTALDALLNEFTLELPFAPDTFIVQVRSATGVVLDGTITDTFTYDGSPLGVKVTKAGGAHVSAGDIITVLAISL